jgi:hypothetical protein
VCLTLATTAGAQTPQPTPAPGERPTIGSVLTAETLAELPLGGNIYSALETVQAELISDRFNSAGLNAGAPARIGGFLGSWSQSSFRIGDLDVTDPVGSGAPLLFPEVVFWEQAGVATGLMSSEVISPGLAVTLQPKRPSPQWTTTAYVSGSGGGLASPTPDGIAPPIERLRDSTHLSALVSGPVLAGRLGIAAGGTWTGSSKFMREQPAGDSSLASGFLNLEYAASPVFTSRTLLWIQHADTPFEHAATFGTPDTLSEDTSTHVQTTLERTGASGPSWRVFGGLTARSRSVKLPGIAAVNVDRLLSGPLPYLVAASGEADAHRWTLGGRMTLPASRTPEGHAIDFGLDIDRAALGTSNQFAGSIGELVDGIPARAWAFARPGTKSNRHASTVAAFASDRIALLPGVDLDAAIRFEWVTGGADDATTGVGWLTLLPRAVLRWEFSDRGRMAVFGGYRRAANRLNLDALAFGDPAAPTALVTRWTGGPLPEAPGSGGELIDRVGPGTGGDPAFSRVDPDLARPHTDEYAVGFDSLVRGWLRLELTGLARRETNAIANVEVGVPDSSYSTIGIPDLGWDLTGDQDDQVLTVYNRLPSSFGLNQYLLTNPDVQPATAWALMFTADASTERLFLLFGATASIAEGSAGNRGHLPVENDQDALGDLFTNPNSAVYARGRLFAERAFTIKWTTVYRFPWDVRFGAIARYQDGQSFSRFVIAPDLNQGAEPVRAFTNGKSRFTFTGSLDLRLQKGFVIGAGRVDAILDVYNLLTRDNEVEENVATGPNYRVSTALQPSRSVHVGLRLAF